MLLSAKENVKLNVLKVLKTKVQNLDRTENIVCPLFVERAYSSTTTIYTILYYIIFRSRGSFKSFTSITNYIKFESKILNV